MTQFQASLIAAGDPQPLPTTVELNQGMLKIASNGQALGDWAVSELEFERIVGGFRVKLDGEVAVLKLVESDQFGRELARFNGPDVEPTTAVKERKKKDKAATEAKAPRRPRKAAATTEPATPAAAVDSSAPGAGTTFLDKLDQRLEVASKKWDRYLPDWVFTRGGVTVGLLALVAIFVFSTIFSTIFLIVAAIGLITSAIALLDQVIATRIFRGGFTPIHGLIGSLCLVLVSLLLAAI